MIYVAKGILEDREPIIGYFEGDYSDVDAYVYHKYGARYYEIKIAELKPERIPDGYHKNLNELLRDKATLELKLKQLQNLIDAKG